MSYQHEVNIEDIQFRILKILTEFDNFCQRNNLQYFILGGTLLGAVRHQGFIPWDDDIDIGMLREDYEKAIKLFNKEYGKNNYYVLEEKRINNEHVYTFTKVYDVYSTVVIDFIKPVKKGLWIDVFPIDATFQCKVLRYIHFYSIRSLKQLCIIKDKAYKHDKITIINFARDVIYYLIYGISSKKIYYLLNKVLKLKKTSKAKYFGNMLGRWGLKEIVNAEVFENTIDLKFSDKNFKAPIFYDKYLKTLYGDYMVLPPNEERKAHDLLNINLDESFKNRSLK